MELISGDIVQVAVHDLAAFIFLTSVQPSHSPALSAEGFRAALFHCS
jgi:hypothetical protein